MKKLFTLLLTLITVFSCFSVSAAETDVLDFLDFEPGSYKAEGTINFKLNKPLQILDLLEQETASVGMPFDLKMLMSSLLDTKMSYTEKTIIDSDGKTIKSEIEYNSDFPLVFSDNLSVDIKAKQLCWTLFDGNDIKVIQEAPNDKYIYVNYSELFAQDMYDDMIDISKIANYTTFTNDINRIMKDRYTVTTSGNKVTLTLSEEEFKNAVIDILEYFEMPREDIDEVVKALVSVQIFDKNAVECEYRLNRQGKIESAKAKINIKTNIYDIIAQTDGDTTGLERDKSFIDISITNDVKYKYTNVKVDVPELTEENSYNPFVMAQEDIYDENYEEYTYNDCYYYAETKEEYLSAVSNNRFPVDKVIKGLTINSKDISDAEIVYTDGIIKIEDSEDNFYLHIAVGTGHVWYENTDIYLDNPILEENGAVYVTPEFMEKLFGLELGYAAYYPDDETGALSFYEIYYEEV